MRKKCANCLLAHAWVNQALESCNAGMWENTLMVLSSDNGGYVGDYKGGCNTSTGFDGLDSTGKQSCPILVILT